MRRGVRVIDRGCVVIALDGGLFQRPIHAFDLAVRPGMIGLGQATLDAVFTTSHREHVRHVSRRRAGERNAVVGQHRVDFIRNRLDQRFWPIMRPLSMEPESVP